jgi:hypothetical protein
MGNGTKWNVAGVGQATPESPDPRETGKPFYVVIGLFKGALAPSMYYTDKADADAEAQRLATESPSSRFGVAEVQTIAKIRAAELVSLLKG